jgi:TRAP-type C4-dicarboxylate transport system permease small subunit
MQSVTDERSLGDLFADLARETGDLVRKEVALAKAEMSQKAARAGRDIAVLAVGGLIAYAGLLAMIAALIIGLGSLGLPWWLSALLVGIVVAGIGYFMIQRGLNALKREDLAPKQTIESIKEDAEMIKEQVT